MDLHFNEYRQYYQGRIKRRGHATHIQSYVSSKIWSWKQDVKQDILYLAVIESIIDAALIRGKYSDSARALFTFGVYYI